MDWATIRPDATSRLRLQRCRRGNCLLTRRQCRQRGASLIEFAFVLPLLLLILVGTMFFGYVYVLQSTVTHAAQQGAIAAVAVPVAGNDDFWNAAITAARQAAERSSDWLPSSITECRSVNPEHVQVTVGGETRQALQVTVSIGIMNCSSALLPNIPFMDLGLADVTGVAKVVL